MRVSYQVFKLPKLGNSDEEYEDAFDVQGMMPVVPVEPITALPSLLPQADCQGDLTDLEHFSCAVADGATETSFSGLWARMLCQKFCDLATAKVQGTFFDSLPELQSIWREQVSSKPLPWFAEEKARKGAFSSLVGFTASEERGTGALHFHATAVGDSCLFHIREDRLIQAFPLSNYHDFSNSPFLISSTQTWDEHSEAQALPYSGECQNGDVFFFMTDAIAAWFLHTRDFDKDDAIIRFLREIEKKESFLRFIQHAREPDKHEPGTHEPPVMRNDDVTFVRIEINRS